jgi:hypothetical protein
MLFYIAQPANAPAPGPGPSRVTRRRMAAQDGVPTAVADAAMPTFRVQGNVSLHLFCDG